MRKGTKYILLLLLIVSSCSCFSQNQKIDSLKNKLKICDEDTMMVNILTKLSWQYIISGNPDTALIYCNKDLEVCEKLSDKINNNIEFLCVKKNLGKTYNNFGLVYKDKFYYPIALDYFLKALQVYKEAEKKLPEYTLELLGMRSKAIANMGVVHYLMGDLTKAIENSFEALRIAEKLGDKQLLSNTLGMVGAIYMSEGENYKALDYDFKALKIAREMKNNHSIAIHLGNIGNLYNALGSLAIKNSIKDSLFKMALKFDQEAIETNEKMGNKAEVARNMGNIGLVYANKGDIELALKYYFKALKVNEEMQNKGTISNVLGNIGDLYVSQNKFNEAKDYLERALKLAEDLKIGIFIRNWNKALSDMYFKQKDWQKSLYHYRNYISARDSIANDENTKKQTQTEMQYGFDKKESETKAEQDKKDAVTKIIIYSISGGLFLVLLLAIFIFRSFRQKQKANVMISFQKEEVEKQKYLVEEKQKDILDSIRYAKRIQMSLMPAEKYIIKNLKGLRKN